MIDCIIKPLYFKSYVSCRLHVETNFDAGSRRFGPVLYVVSFPFLRLSLNSLLGVIE